jgi:hypothetical protein
LRIQGVNRFSHLEQREFSIDVSLVESFSGLVETESFKAQGSKGFFVNADPLGPFSRA